MLKLSNVLTIILVAAGTTLAHAQETTGGRSIGATLPGGPANSGAWDFFPISDASGNRNEIAAWLVNHNTGSVYVCSSSGHQAGAGGLKCVKGSYDTPPSP